MNYHPTTFVPRTSVDYWRTRHELAEVTIKVETERAERLQKEVEALKAKLERL